MQDTTVLLAFAASFFFIAASPGLCMTLAMSLGIRLGLRRTLWMMAGELVGVGLVAAAAVLGVGSLILGAPVAFALFKIAGAAYLFWSGWQCWLSPPPTLEATAATGDQSRAQLALQGFVTAASNPKAWAFNAALLPPFIDPARALAPQLTALLVILLCIEFVCLLAYAQGGRTLARWLTRGGHARWLNRVSAVLMWAVGIWLLAS
ncbi:LysE family translocator [Abyssibacter profundi]|uniref:Threonine transporter RhtB n=1 Tax=Abyssibacter profundi TaxID=2182787 RepID=A0A363UJY8_9GAMM|nr:LysE family translocator [Abyssibacter profundi]MBV60446.1 threonine transporter RhtB [Nevskiales bacterium]PWN55714.1 threonine transporter RhtB [Abyssibacter profundi]